jgi:hypothetical protein
MPSPCLQPPVFLLFAGPKDTGRLSRHYAHRIRQKACGLWICFMAEHISRLAGFSFSGTLTPVRDVRHAEAINSSRVYF